MPKQRLRLHSIPGEFLLKEIDWLLSDHIFHQHLVFVFIEFLHQWSELFPFSLSVNCEEFLSKEESQIPVEEIFFHRWVWNDFIEKLLTKCIFYFSRYFFVFTQTQRHYYETFFYSTASLRSVNRRSSFRIAGSEKTAITRAWRTWTTRSLRNCSVSRDERWSFLKKKKTTT